VGKSAQAQFQQADARYGRPQQTTPARIDLFRHGRFSLKIAPQFFDCANDITGSATVVASNSD
jgi:hypothetical protein